MKWFFWQKNRAVEAFARALADDLSSYLQPEVLAEHLAGIAGSDNKKKTAKAVGPRTLISCMPLPAGMRRLGK